jgi:hypothetical protein
MFAFPGESNYNPLRSRLLISFFLKINFSIESLSVARRPNRKYLQPEEAYL